MMGDLVKMEPVSNLSDIFTVVYLLTHFERKRRNISTYQSLKTLLSVLKTAMPMAASTMTRPQKLLHMGSLPITSSQRMASSFLEKERGKTNAAVKPSFELAIIWSGMHIPSAA